MIICAENKRFLPGETIQGFVWLFAFIVLKVEWYGDNSIGFEVP